MLGPEELFPLYAELSLGLAGFAGVVSAFAGRDRTFRPTERVRFLSVVMASACVLAGCFTLFAALAGGLSLSISYRLCGAVCLIVALVPFFPNFISAWRHAEDPDSTTEYWSLYVSLGSYAAVCSLYGAAALADWGFACLVGGFSIQLLHGLWMFVRVLTRAN
jgi:hypothetical protein